MPGRIVKSWLRVLLAVLFLQGVAGLGELFPAQEKLGDRMYSNLRNISLALERSGRAGESIDLLMPYRSDPRVLKLLESLFRKTGKDKDFLPLAGEAARGDPENQQVLTVYIKVLYNCALQDSILHVTARYVEGGPGKPGRYLFAGNQLRKYHFFDNALALYEKGRKRLRDSVLFSRETAALLIDLGRYDRALDELLSFLKARPEGLTLARHEVYRILDAGEGGRGGREKLVTQKLSRALDDAQGEGAFRKCLVTLLVDIDLTLGRPREAFSGLRELIELSEPKSAVEHFHLFIGRCLKIEEYEPAIRAYGLADSLELIGREKALLGRADIWEKMGELEKVENVLSSLTQDRGGRSAEARLNALGRLGDLYLERLDRPDDALSMYRELEKTGRKRDKGLVDAKLKIIKSFIRLGRLAEARELAQELLSGKPRDPGPASRVLILLGNIFFYGGEPDSAANAYIAFAKMRLAEPEANDVIGRVYLIQNDKSPGVRLSRQVGAALYRAECGEIQQAAELFRKTLHETADSSFMAQVCYQMGRMYEKAGEFPLALGVYGELVKEHGGSHLAPLAELRMGLILLDGVGDSTGARKHLERVVFEYPPGVATPQARRLLRSLEKEKL